MALNILFFSHKFYPDIGGIESNSEVLAHAFVEAGHNVHLITWSQGGPLKKFPFKVIRNPDKKILFQEHSWAEVVFENNPCLRLSWPNLIFRRPSVIALNTWVSRADGSLGLKDRLKLLLLKRAKKVIAVSNAVRERCWPAAIVIANPYKDNLFKVIPDSARSSDFVFLGRLVSDKGADQAIIAIKHFPSSTLTIIGDGPELNNLKNLTLELGVEDRINFTGSLREEKLVSCLNRHKYILIPSMWEEPFGNVALEGMACGCLPIASNSGGLPDAVGKAGFTFKRGDINDFINSIRTIINNPTLEKQMRGETFSHLAIHRPEIVSKKYLEVIEDAIALK